jgi:hypothetical protein
MSQTRYIPKAGTRAGDIKINGIVIRIYTDGNIQTQRAAKLTAKQYNTTTARARQPAARIKYQSVRSGRSGFGGGGYGITTISISPSSSSSSSACFSEPSENELPKAKDGRSCGMIGMGTEGEHAVAGAGGGGCGGDDTTREGSASCTGGGQCTCVDEVGSG